MKQPPKVFLSYSTEYAENQQWVIDLCNQLRSDGIDATMDVYELKHGQDMYAFMERIVSDEFDRIIVVSDWSYANRANTRKGGVGAETQLLTPEIYNSINQEKVIPVYTELDADNNPSLPLFLKSRFAIDFSNPANYEQKYAELFLAIKGRPLYTKPPTGKDSNIEKMKAMAKRKSTTNNQKNFIKGAVENIDNMDIGDDAPSLDQGKYAMKNGIIGNVKNVKNLRIGDGPRKS